MELNPGATLYRRAVSEQKKSAIWLSMDRGTIFLVKTAPLCRWGAKTVPQGAPNYGQPNSTPRGAVLSPFFLSAWDGTVP